MNMIALVAYFSNPGHINDRVIPGDKYSEPKWPIRQAAYYIILEAFINIGRSSIFVSTISLANSFSHSNSRRDRLINNRNTF